MNFYFSSRFIVRLAHVKTVPIQKAETLNVLFLTLGAPSLVTLKSRQFKSYFIKKEDLSPKTENICKEIQYRLFCKKVFWIIYFILNIAHDHGDFAIFRLKAIAIFTPSPKGCPYTIWSGFVCFVFTNFTSFEFWVDINYVYYPIVFSGICFKFWFLIMIFS